MQATWVAFLPKLRLYPKGKGHCTSKHERNLKMQVEQRVNRCGLGVVFFFSKWFWEAWGEAVGVLQG